MPERNLAQRLRAFRLQHGFTLKDTAYLLDLSLSHLHALETAQRSPSPRTRFKLLRLLTLPFPNRDSLERDTRSYRQQHLDALKTLLSIPPPEPVELTDDSDRLHHLRYLWLTSTDSTRHLAARLGISQPHLIRLLRGDRRPSRSLRQRLELLTAPPCLPCLS
jgi:transcriptional regulator with XRE-family HTH domain